MKEKLYTYRKELDYIDKNIMELYIKRMEIVKKIAQEKFENNLDIEDHNRENEMKAKIINSDNEIISKYYLEVMKALLTSSKNYQEALIDVFKK